MKNDYDAPEDESGDDYYEPDGLRWISIAVVVLVIFGFFSLAWYAYRTNSNAVDESSVLLVEADDTPVKEKPENPGGMEFEHKDKEIYNRMVAEEPETAEPVEKLLPEPEEPVVERSGKNKEQLSSWINDKLHPGEIEAKKKPVKESPKFIKEDEEPVAEEEAKKSVDSSEEKAETAEDKKPVEKETAEDKKEEVKVEKEPLPETSKPEAKEDSVEVKEAPVATEAVEVKPEPVKETPKPVEKAEPKPVEKKPEPAPKADPIVSAAEDYAKPATPAPAPSTGGGNFKAQLASLRTRAEAETTLSRLRAKHADLLGGKSFEIIEANIPEKGMYYRIRVGGIGSKQAVTSLCSSLSARGQGCMPVQ